VEEDNPQIDKNNFISRDDLFKMLDSIIIGVKSLIDMGVRVNLQVDNSKVSTEKKQVVRIIIHYEEKAPSMEDIPKEEGISEAGVISESAWASLVKRDLPENPFSDLPECEEPEERKPPK
jgi:hypothetical protein